MGKNYEAPVQVRQLEKMITNFTYHNGFEISRVFDDWLQFIICNFTIDPQPNPDWKYKPGHNKMFNDLMIEWIKTMQREITDDNQWFDAFGCLYEAFVASGSRRSNAGQFFTPEHICDLMTKISGTADNMKGKGLRVNDPTCGSGRILLSFHIQAPGNYLCGEDLDKSCCLMTVCNFIIHGVVGEVIWHDSLQPDSWFGGWKINENLNNPLHKYCGMPHVEVLKKENSFVYQFWEQKKLEVLKKKELTVPNIEIPITNTESIQRNKKSKQNITQLQLEFF